MQDHASDVDDGPSVKLRSMVVGPVIEAQQPYSSLEDNVEDLLQEDAMPRHLALLVEQDCPTRLGSGFVDFEAVSSPHLGLTYAAGFDYLLESP